jgi:hypothetical protein
MELNLCLKSASHDQIFFKFCLYISDLKKLKKKEIKTNVKVGEFSYDQVCVGFQDAMHLTGLNNNNNNNDNTDHVCIKAIGFFLFDYFGCLVLLGIVPSYLCILFSFLIHINLFQKK